ncbi:11430_t:CDS:2, partial [Diversispora eburnea]
MDLDNLWAGRFISEATKFGAALGPQVGLERERNNLEAYWNKVIDACKIKQNILAYEKEKERIQLEHLRKLNEIDKKIETENIELIRNSNKWKDGNS